MEWRQCEWHEKGYETEHEGYTASVTPDDDGGWFWRVDATSAVSEYPEVQDCEIAPSRNVAKARAEQALLKATARGNALTEQIIGDEEYRKEFPHHAGY